MYAPDVVLLDVMGTLVPKRHIKEVVAYLQRPDIAGLVAQHAGVRPDEIEGIVQEGLRLSKAGQKDSAGFKKYMELYDEAARLGYEHEELRAPLYPDVHHAVDAFKDGGAHVAVYSNEAAGTLRGALASCGLEDKVDCAFSAKDAGDKYAIGSYTGICQALGKEPVQVSFITDDAVEALAASRAGLGYVILVTREGERQVAAAQYGVVRTLAEAERLLRAREPLA